MTVRIQITKRGVYGAQGPIPIGTEIDLNEEPKGWAGRYIVLSNSKGKKGVTNPAETAPAAPEGPFTVEDGGKGWWSIKDGSGEKVGASVREDDAKAFETLSDEDKAAFAAEHAKG